MIEQFFLNRFEVVLIEDSQDEIVMSKRLYR